MYEMQVPILNANNKTTNLNLLAYPQGARLILHKKNE